MKKLPIVTHGNVSEEKVALTFDDGPNPYATPQILDILKQEGCKASFFCIGRWAEKYPEIILRMVAEGHTIGGHTYLHGGDDRSGSYGEFIKGNQKLENLTGSKVHFVRVPQYGYDKVDKGIPRISELLGDLKKEVDSRELIVVGANVFSHDWRYIIPSKLILSNVLNNLSNGAIIGLHDGSEKEHEIKDRVNRTVQVLPQMIKEIQAKGLVPVALSEMDLVFDTLSVAQ